MPEDRDGWAGWLGSLEREAPPEEREWLDRIAFHVIDRVSPRPGETVVDLGAGTGLLSLKVARLVGRRGKVVAVDSSAACLEALALKARRASLSNLAVRQGDLTSLPLETASCDCAVCRSAFTYTTDVVGALREMKRILVPGGRYGAFEPLQVEAEVVPRREGARPDEEVVLMERTLREKRSAHSPDRAALRDAFREAGLGEHDSLALHFTVTMEGRDAEEVAGEYLRDLPGELSAFSLLEPEFGERRVLGAAERFADQVCRGDLAVRVPGLLIWGRRRSVQ